MIKLSHQGEIKLVLVGVLHFPKRIDEGNKPYEKPNKICDTEHENRLLFNQTKTKNYCSMTRKIKLGKRLNHSSLPVSLANNHQQERYHERALECFSLFAKVDLQPASRFMQIDKL